LHCHDLGYRDLHPDNFILTEGDSFLNYPGEGGRSRLSISHSEVPSPPSTRHGISFNQRKYMASNCLRTTSP
jgi:hypothetical protein